MVNHVNFIWNIAESLRGPFKPSEYGSVVLPFTVLRRLDAVLADTKAEVLKVAPTVENAPDVLKQMKLTEVSGHQFFAQAPPLTVPCEDLADCPSLARHRLSCSAGDGVLEQSGTIPEISGTDSSGRFEIPRHP